MAVHVREPRVHHGRQVRARCVTAVVHRTTSPICRSVSPALRLPDEHHTVDRLGGVVPVAEERALFLAEANRVATELVVIDSALRPGVAAEQRQPRERNDGSRHRIYKRYLSASQLADEIDGEVLLERMWFVAARKR